MLAFLRKWLAILTIFYLVGGISSCSIFMLADEFTKPHGLLAKLLPGITPVDAEAIIGRPPEYKHDYTCVPDCGPFSHNWTINNYRVEVIFDRSGHATDVFTYRGAPGRIERLIGRFFFWWTPDFD